MSVANRTITLWLGSLLVLATGAAYLNSLAGPFHFDDMLGIVDNPTIRRLWPLSEPLTPPGGGHSLAGRPVANLTFALNHAVDGFEVRGYHLVNLLIHLAAGLVLFGVVHRTLGLGPVGRDRLIPPSSGHDNAPEAGSAIPPYRGAARWLAFATALLWLLHPLQTESVTYVIQRTESLAGLFYLLGLYGFIRGTEDGAAKARAWLGLGIASVWLGMATKETVATLPLILLLYDRAFVSGSFREAWRWHGKIHGLMAAAWLLLAWLMAGTGGRGGTAFWYEEATAWPTLLTQSRAVAGYLQLAVWPAPLVFDYGDYPEEMVWRLGEVWPQFLLLTGLGGATLFALWKWPRVGFLGAWFFVILAPTSSFIPIITQLRAEHRMYLPLAAVVVATVVLLHRLAGRAVVVVVAALALVLGGLTRARNDDYRSGLSLWADTAQKRPDNARARNNHGLALQHAGDAEGAIREFQVALDREPDYFDAHLNLASALMEGGRLDEGRVHLDAAVALRPRSSNDYNNLSRLFFLLRDFPQAREYLDQAIRADPTNFEAHNNLGCVLVEEGRATEALPHFQRSLELRPNADTCANLGDAFEKAGDLPGARASFSAALRLDPAHARAAERLRRLDTRP